MNRYDDFRPDVPRLLAEQSARLPVKPPGARSGHGLGPLGRLASRLRLGALGHFHTVLRPGGVLIFDYVRSEATGLDTPAALRDREPALRFIADRFEPVEGRIAIDGGDQPTTVVRKRG